LATKNSINKYPTLKLYRYGIAVKREYRGARFVVIVIVIVVVIITILLFKKLISFFFFFNRNVDAFVSFVREQLNDSVKVANSYGELNSIEVSK
jgi:hypothetical protein